MTTLFTNKTEQLVRWHKLGLISRESAILRFKAMLTERQGQYNNVEDIKRRAANKLLDDLIAV